MKIQVDESTPNTGFKDKNGKNIRRGDIVKYQDSEGAYIINFYDQDGKYKIGGLDLENESSKLTVTSNLFENTQKMRKRQNLD